MHFCRRSQRLVPVCWAGSWADQTYQHFESLCGCEHPLSCQNCPLAHGHTRAVRTVQSSFFFSRLVVTTVHALWGTELNIWRNDKNTPCLFSLLAMPKCSTRTTALFTLLCEGGVLTGSLSWPTFAIKMSLFNCDALARRPEWADDSTSFHSLLTKTTPANVALRIHICELYSVFFAH